MPVPRAMNARPLLLERGVGLQGARAGTAFEHAPRSAKSGRGHKWAGHLVGRRDTWFPLSLCARV